MASSAQKLHDLDMPAKGTLEEPVHSPCPSLIYDDHWWNIDVLKLSDRETEEVLDKDYALQAKEAGIEVPNEEEDGTYHQESFAATSSLSVSSPRGSSVSLRSSLSTGITDPSRTSRDTQGNASLLSVPLPTQRQPIPSLSSLGHNSYDSVVETIRPQLKQTESSTMSTSSSFALALDYKSKKPSSRRRRGPLAFFRRESSTCYSRSCYGYNTTSNSQSHMQLQDLECGHSLTDFAIRMHIKEAVERGHRVPPSCCETPIPAIVLARVMSVPEMTTLEHRLAATYGIQRDASESSIKVDYDPNRKPRLKPLCIDVEAAQQPFTKSLQLDVKLPAQSSICLSPLMPLSPRPATLASNLSFEPTADELQQLDRAMEDEAFATLRREQGDEQGRARAFEFRQRSAIEKHYDRLRTDFWEFHTRRRKSLEEEHKQAIENLEEMQMDREMCLQQEQDDERQNVATALKYMEAYCGVPFRSSVVHDDSSFKRVVSDEDRRKLQRQYSIRDNLDLNHEAAVTVLRARQDRVLKVRLKKQNDELIQLDKALQDQLASLGEMQKTDLERVEDQFKSRRKRADRRWTLKFALWKAESDKSRKEPWTTKIPPLEWPDPIESVTDLANSAGISLDQISVVV